MDSFQNITNSSVKSTMDRQEFFKLVGVSVGAIILQQCLSGCSTKDDPQPDALSDFSINVNNGSYMALRSRGGFTYINGIIVARTQQDAYLAVSQVCTHEGTRINYDSASNTFVCPNHGAVFSDRGEVKKGPATKPLTVYRTSYDATTGELKILT